MAYLLHRIATIQSKAHIWPLGKKWKVSKTLFFNKSRSRAESITNLLFQFIKCSWLWLADCVLAQPHKNSRGVRLGLCGKDCAGLGTQTSDHPRCVTHNQSHIWSTFTCILFLTVSHMYMLLESQQMEKQNSTDTELWNLVGASRWKLQWLPSDTTALD